MKNNILITLLIFLISFSIIYAQEKTLPKIRITSMDVEKIFKESAVDGKSGNLANLKMGNARQMFPENNVKINDLLISNEKIALKDFDLSKLKLKPKSETSFNFSPLFASKKTILKKHNIAPGKNLIDQKQLEKLFK